MTLRFSFPSLAATPMQALVLADILLSFQMEVIKYLGKEPQRADRLFQDKVHPSVKATVAAA